MTNKQIYFKLISWIALLFLLINLNLTQTKELTLFKKKIQNGKQPTTQAYFLKLDIANLKVNLHASINAKNTWLKSDKCQVCSLGQNLPDNQQNSKNPKNSVGNFQCQDSCFNNDQQYGVKCIKSHCTIISKVQNEDFILSGQKVELQALSQEIQQKSQKLKLKSILVQKIKKVKQQTKNRHNQKYQFDGQYAIFGQRQMSSLLQNSFLVKGTYQDNNKIINQIISIYDNQKDVSSFIIENDKTTLQISSPSQIQETATNFQYMEFGVSQIKIVDLSNINHEGNYAKSIEIPVNPVARGFLSLDTDKLHLPSKHFHKFVQEIIKNYFTSSSQSGSRTNICQFSQGSITCSEQISLEKIQYTELQLVINGVSLKFPLKILIQNCKQKSCQFLITKSQHFIIGDFILNAFIISSTNSNNQLNLIFNRLDNQFGKVYKIDQKYKKQKFSLIWWIISTIYFLFYYFFLIVFYLAIFSILINCFVHWRKVLKWANKICQKIQRKYKNKSNFTNSENQQQNDRDTSKLIKKENQSRSTLPSMQQQQFISQK